MDDLEVISKNKNQRVVYAQKLSTQNKFYNDLYKKSFVAFGILFVLIKFYGASINFFDPYSFYVYSSASGKFISVGLTEFLSILGLAGTSYYVNSKSPKQSAAREKLVFYNIFVGIILFVYWYYSSGLFSLSAWFGGGNVLFGCLCYAVTSSMNNSEQEIKKFLKWALEHSS